MATVLLKKRAGASRRILVSCSGKECSGTDPSVETADRVASKR